MELIILFIIGFKRKVNLTNYFTPFHIILSTSYNNTSIFIIQGISKRKYKNSILYHMSIQ